MAQSVIESELSIRAEAPNPFGDGLRCGVELMGGRCLAGVDGLRDRSSKPHSLPS